MLGRESDVRLDLSAQPEFDYWRWVNYWYPLRAVVPFKRNVYRSALQELAPLLFPDDAAMATPPGIPGRRRHDCFGKTAR